MSGEMTDEQFDEIIAAITAQLRSAGHDPALLEVDSERRKVRLPLTVGTKFSMTRIALADLGRDPPQIAEAFYTRYQERAARPG
jgi:hypothetical protein